MAAPDADHLARVVVQRDQRLDAAERRCARGARMHEASDQAHALALLHQPHARERQARPLGGAAGFGQLLDRHVLPRDVLARGQVDQHGRGLAGHQHVDRQGFAAFVQPRVTVVEHHLQAGPLERPAGLVARQHQELRPLADQHLARLGELQAVGRDGALDDRARHRRRIAALAGAEQQHRDLDGHRHAEKADHDEADRAQHLLLAQRLFGRDLLAGVVLDLLQHALEAVGHVVFHQRHRAAVRAGVFVQAGAAQRAAAALAAFEGLQVDAHGASFSLRSSLTSRTHRRCLQPPRRCPAAARAARSAARDAPDRLRSRPRR
ncbi:hypothetical protein D9M68_533850 [compost metagenome]